MIIKCSWLSASLKSEQTQLGGSTSECKEINYYILHLLTRMHLSEECWPSARLELDLLKILIIILMKLIQRCLKQELICGLHQPLP